MTSPSLSNNASRRPQVFSDRSGRRWRISKYFLGFALIGVILLSFFGLDSTYRSTRSLLALQAQEEIQTTLTRYPVVYELGGEDYPHFKEHYPHFSTVLYRGELTLESPALTFHQKYLPEVAKYYIFDPLPGRALSGELLDFLRIWGFEGVVLGTGLVQITRQDSMALVLDQLRQANLEAAYFFRANQEGPNWIRESSATVYRFVQARDLAAGFVPKNPTEILLFEFVYVTKNGVVGQVSDFTEAVASAADRELAFSYRALGYLGEYEFVDSVVVANYLALHPSVTRYGFAGLSRVDTRAWSLGVGGLPQEYALSTVIDLRGEGEMYYLVEEAKLLRVDYAQTGGVIYGARIRQVPQSALVQRYGLQTGKINLSFDDGPHPQWTPKILDYLAEQNLQATFFVTGINVRKHPDLARRIVAEGHEIANHTYLHPRTYELSPQVFTSEVLETQRAIVETTGVLPRYFRTPYNDTDGYVTNRDLKNLRILQDLGLQVSEFETDTKDWTKPGVEVQLANVERQLETGLYSQVLFHDGGGDRAETLAALPQVVKLLRAREIQIVPLSTLNFSQEVAPPKVSTWGRIRAAAQFVNSRYIQVGIMRYAQFFALVALAKLGLSLFLFGVAILRRRRYTRAQPGVSVIIPAYNEQKTILHTVASVLASNYPTLEVVVVNDGSKDNTRRVLERAFGTHPQVTLIHKKNGGKAAASNAGIKRARYDYILGIDADTVIKPDAIALLMRNFVSSQIAGVAGNVHVGNFRNFLTNTQRAEYIYGQSFDKEVYSLTNSIPVVPGALGIWRKAAIIEAGGYRSDTLAEDTDLTLHIRRLGYRILFEREAVVVTEAPETLEQFMKQRNRWMYGTLQCLWKHRRMIGNPRYGYLGLVILPEILLSFLFLGMVLVYLYLLGVLFLNYAVAFFNARADVEALIGADLTITLMYVFGSLGIYYLLNVLAVVFDNNKDKWRVLWYLPYQMLVYRFLLWSAQLLAVLKALRGAHQGWNHLTRRGLELPKG